MVWLVSSRTYLGWSCGEALGWLVCVESVEEVGEVGAGELPFEGFGDLLVAAAEVEEVLFERVEVLEVVGLECFALGVGCAERN